MGTWFVLMRSYYLLLERVRASMEHSSDSSLQTRYTIIVPPYLSLSSYLELGAKAHGRAVSCKWSVRSGPDWQLPERMQVTREHSEQW